MNGDGKQNGGDESNLLMWTPELLQDAMRHIYQRVLFEHVHDIQEIAVQVGYLSGFHIYRQRFVHTGGLKPLIIFTSISR